MVAYQHVSTISPTVANAVGAQLYCYVDRNFTAIASSLLLSAYAFDDEPWRTKNATAERIKLFRRFRPGMGPELPDPPSQPVSLHPTPGEYIFDNSIARR